MHNLLRTLEEEKKVKWPEFLGELVYAYNCSPHSSTGFAPYFLLTGQRSRLPVDLMLGEPRADEGPEQVDEWVEIHRRRLDSAFDQVSRKINQKAAQRKSTHDQKVTTTELKPGDRVLLRKRIVGRNKIQDYWNSIPYVVTCMKRVKSSNAYRVKPVDGVGVVKTANRVDLLHCGYLDEFENEPSKNSSCDLRNSHQTNLDSSHFSDSDSDSEYELQLEEDEHVSDFVHSDDDIEIRVQDDRGRDIANVMHVTDFSDVEHGTLGNNAGELQNLRRSSRKTAGKHSNLYKLPKSANQSNHYVTYDVFADSVQKLGESLSTTLGNVLKGSFFLSLKKE